MRRRTALVFACAILLLVAQAEASSVQELGDKPPFPAADCPTDCQAIAQVTGFQVQLGTAKNPFRVSKNGKIVAWTVRLAKPNASEVEFFKSTFGSTPEARLSVVRSLKSKHQYKLIGQSELFKLERYFGSTQTFTLSKPLPARKDDIIAITVPTWLPAFAHNLPDTMAWRASHPSSQCGANPPPAAHQTVGTTKTYACFYRTARLLFSVTFVPNPTTTNP